MCMGFQDLLADNGNFLEQNTALHGIQTRSSDENSVCPSVRRVNCDKTEEKSVQIFTPYE